MRVTVINRNNLAAFSQLREKIGPGSAIEQLKNLNPHVDFTKIDAGTVLLIPETSDFNDAASASLAGDVFNPLREQMLASVEVATSRVREGYAALLTEQKEVAVVLKSAALKRALESDPDLKPQIEAANQVLKRDQQAAKDAEKTMQTLQEQAAGELASLMQMLG